MKQITQHFFGRWESDFNWMNKLKFLFSHFFLLPQKDLWRPWYLKEEWKWKFKLIFILTFCFLKYKGQRAFTNFFLIVKINLNNVIFQRKPYIGITQSLPGANIGLIWHQCADSSCFLQWAPKQIKEINFWNIVISFFETFLLPISSEK